MLPIRDNQVINAIVAVILAAGITVGGLTTTSISNTGTETSVGIVDTGALSVTATSTLASIIASGTETLTGAETQGILSSVGTTTGLTANFTVQSGSVATSTMALGSGNEGSKSSQFCLYNGTQYVKMWYVGATLTTSTSATCP